MELRSNCEQPLRLALSNAGRQQPDGHPALDEDRAPGPRKFDADMRLEHTEKVFTVQRERSVQK